MSRSKPDITQTDKKLSEDKIIDLYYLFFDEFTKFIYSLK